MSDWYPVPQTIYKRRSESHDSCGWPGNPGSNPPSILISTKSKQITYTETTSNIPIPDNLITLKIDASAGGGGGSFPDTPVTSSGGSGGGGGAGAVASVIIKATDLLAAFGEGSELKTMNVTVGKGGVAPGVTYPGPVPPSTNGRVTEVFVVGGIGTEDVNLEILTLDYGRSGNPDGSGGIGGDIEKSGFFQPSVISEASGQSGHNGGISGGNGGSNSLGTGGLGGFVPSASPTGNPPRDATDGTRGGGGGGGMILSGSTVALAQAGSGGDGIVKITFTTTA